MHHGEIWRSRRGWTWRLKAKNGQVVGTAHQGFYGKHQSNARRAFNNMLKGLGVDPRTIEIKVVKDLLP